MFLYNIPDINQSNIENNVLFPHNTILRNNNRGGVQFQDPYLTFLKGTSKVLHIKRKIFSRIALAFLCLKFFVFSSRMHNYGLVDKIPDDA